MPSAVRRCDLGRAPSLGLRICEAGPRRQDSQVLCGVRGTVAGKVGGSCCLLVSPASPLHGTEPPPGVTGLRCSGLPGSAILPSRASSASQSRNTPVNAVTTQHWSREAEHEPRFISAGLRNGEPTEQLRQRL